ncbi:MAG: hypothetical protein KF726_03905 [Anaerolineae bacterium]|nr:hypothetical protein [Anaerolineae bacterium]
MATLESAAGVRAQPNLESRPAGSVRFDLASAGLSIWFMLGVFLDGWAHNHGRVDNTFFTPWHAVLYSGALAVAALLTLTQFRNMQRGYAWSKSLPQGYGWSLVGVGVFFAAGGFDFLWHGWFGFEAGLETLLSPAHFALGTGAFLFLTGPIRAAYQRRTQLSGWSNLLPVILSSTLLLSLFTFFTMYANPITQARAFTVNTGNGRDFRDLQIIWGIAGVLILTAFTMGIVLTLLRRWKLPFGTLTFMLTANALLLIWVYWKTTNPMLLTYISLPLAGLVGDWLLALIKPSLDRPNSFRLIGFLLPVLEFSAFFGLLISNYGTWWSVHLWAGLIFMAGVVGLLLSYLVVPYASEK